MHCLNTLARLNAERTEAARLLNARAPGAKPVKTEPFPQRENPHATIKRLLDGAKG